MLEKIMKDGLKAGAYLTVVSWENDGDNYATKMVHYPTLDYALLDSRLLNACSSMYNSGDWDYQEKRHESFPYILSVLEGHKELLSGDLYEIYQEAKSADTDDSESVNNLNHLWDYISNMSYELMGSSEYYYMRVAKSITVNFIEEDVKVNAKLIETTRPNH